MELNLLPKKFKQGQVLIREGAEAQSLFLLREGRALVSRRLEDREVELEELGPNEVFGEISLLEGEPRFTTVRAAQDGEAVVFSRKQLDEMLRRAPLELYLILDGLARKYKRMVKRLLEALRDNGRLERELEELRERLRRLEGHPAGTPPSSPPAPTPPAA